MVLTIEKDPKKKLGEHFTFKRSRHKEAEEKGEKMGKTRKHPKALSCRNTITPTNMTALSNKLQIVTEALLNLFHGSILFPATLAPLLLSFSPIYNRPHSTQDIKSAINQKLHSRILFPNDDPESLINDYTIHILLRMERKHIKTF